MLAMTPAALLMLALAAPSPVAVFDDVWHASRTELVDATLAAEYFSESKHRELREQAKAVASLEELAATVLDPLLRGLSLSHTRFLTRSDLAYYMLRSMFSERQITEPTLHHIGVQLTGEHVIREVLDGYPAMVAGLRRGDRLVAVNDQPYDSVEQFAGATRVSVERAGALLRVAVEPVRQSIHESMRDAMEMSARVMVQGGKRIGYVRLWAGTDPQILRRFQAIIRGLGDVDGMVLDLRGGFGGAWYDYLDSFFADRSSYYRFSVHPRAGEVFEGQAEPRTNPNAYLGPLVVLINEGVRSGKEALAYQFKKSGRATLVGARTRGAFCAGKGIFADRNDGYMLFLAVAEYRLDGKVIEGVGVEPDVAVPYPLDRSAPGDPQLQASLRTLLGQGAL